MKKKSITSLELNKKTISTLKTSKVKAGSWFSVTCMVYVATVGMVVADAIENFTNEE